MGPLSGQKFPKSSAQLNGVPGGQGGVATPEVERSHRWCMGELVGLSQTARGARHLLAFRRRAQTSKVASCLSPAVARPEEQGQGSQRVHAAPRAAPQFSLPAKLREAWGWLQRRQERWDSPA